MTEIKLSDAWLLMKELSESWINETIVRSHHVVSAQDVAARLDALEAENARLREGIKRLSDEEELCAEAAGDDPYSVVYLAAKLAAVEHDLAGAKHAAKNALSDLQYWRGQYEEIAALSTKGEA